MLIGLSPLLGPELLYTLRAMGHGDEIAIVDGNYPADEHGRRVIRADGHGAVEIADAILSVLPVDDFVEHALFRACVGRDPKKLDPVHKELAAICKRRAPKHPLVPLVGDAFYDRVRSAYAVVATSERRLYGNMIIRKGVIHPPN